jgi:hypothetical protein
LGRLEVGCGVEAGKNTSFGAAVYELGMSATNKVLPAPGVIDVEEVICLESSGPGVC